MRKDSREKLGRERWCTRMWRETVSACLNSFKTEGVLLLAGYKVCLKGSIFFPLTFMGDLSHNWLYCGLSLAYLILHRFGRNFSLPVAEYKKQKKPQAKLKSVKCKIWLKPINFMVVGWYSYVRSAAVLRSIYEFWSYQF